MPPKKKTDEEEGLQAIVLSDSYQDRFLPLTRERPRCLLPLANTPLLEYTLEFLATARVAEVFVIGSAHAQQIEEYIQGSKWVSASAPFRVEVIQSDSCSIGDALRDIDRLGLVTNDFLLISGDIVSNIDFSKVLTAHRERNDRNAIMTMVLREASANHRTRAKDGAGLFVIAEPSGQCVRYESAPHDLGTVEIDSEALADFETLSLRNDLIDCHIDICTPDVPALFTENFDYNDLRMDFVKGILTSELLGKTIYTHIVDNQYSARVESYQTYDAVSRDVISRYAYPLTPEYNLLDDQSFRHHFGHIYKEDGVVLAQSCVIGPQSVIGSGTFIGERTQVLQSVVGRRCRVGEGVRLEGAYLWEDVVVEDGAIVERAVVGSGAVIRSGVRVGSGAVVSFGEVVTADKHGAPDDMDSLVYELEGVALSDGSIASDHGRVDREERGKSRGKEAEDTDDEDEEDDFNSEAIASIERAITENHDLDIAVLELNTLRMTLNVGYEDVRAATASALVGYVGKLVSTGTLNVKAAVERIFGQWGLLFKRQAFDLEDEIDVLRLVGELFEGGKIGGSWQQGLVYAMESLYDEDVIDEEAYFGWYRQIASDSALHGVVKAYVEWLENAESE
ncbi:uncharacterized protein SAPINGB_P002554 [Magnusiomyces paraingens]|uniref:Translation initiation factor eIF2B subunit epsilon n=1 Tax=Magnusiomyces paraingens TaxID=2606893 RepID=A0A5E8BKA5_9ASCO|nr:uncharacterized protein SAPINGB_P002554 [Saprochaete ingens]VVT50007.1 unnamed protein product [Saprochaete ingens]